MVRPVLVYGADSWTVVKNDEDLMSRTEVRMLQWILGVSRLEKLRNEEIRRRCGVADIVEKMREARLRWMGHVLRREVDEPSRVALEFEVEGNRGRGRPRRRWRECLKKGMEMRGLEETDAQEMSGWAVGTPTANPRQSGPRLIEHDDDNYVSVHLGGNELKCGPERNWLRPSEKLRMRQIGVDLIQYDFVSAFDVVNQGGRPLHDTIPRKQIFAPCLATTAHIKLQHGSRLVQPFYLH